MPPTVLDQFGRVISEAAPDLYPARCGIAMAIGHIAHLLDPEQVELLFMFFVNTGLGDRKSEVRVEMLKAAVEAVNQHGKVRPGKKTKYTDCNKLLFNSFLIKVLQILDNVHYSYKNY